MKQPAMTKTLMPALISLAMTMSALADGRPNVLFCFSDDWGRYASIYRDPAKPGMNDIIETPALDDIGRRGVVFNNAFVSAPSCTPSRAALLTRRLPIRSGMCSSKRRVLFPDSDGGIQYFLCWYR